MGRRPFHLHRPGVFGPSRRFRCPQPFGPHSPFGPMRGRRSIFNPFGINKPFVPMRGRRSIFNPFGINKPFRPMNLHRPSVFGPSRIFRPFPGACLGVLAGMRINPHIRHRMSACF